MCDIYRQIHMHVCICSVSITTTATVCRIQDRSCSSRTGLSLKSSPTLRPFNKMMTALLPVRNFHKFLLELMPLSLRNVLSHFSLHFFRSMANSFTSPPYFCRRLHFQVRRRGRSLRASISIASKTLSHTRIRAI